MLCLWILVNHKNDEDIGMYYNVYKLKQNLLGGGRKHKELILFDPSDMRPRTACFMVTKSDSCCLELGRCWGEMISNSHCFFWIGWKWSNCCSDSWIIYECTKSHWIVRFLFVCLIFSFRRGLSVFLNVRECTLQTSLFCAPQKLSL